jgi:hypothetical protein
MSVVSGVVSAFAADSAADTQAEATRDATDKEIAAYEKAAEIKAQGAKDAAEVQVQAARDAGEEAKRLLTELQAVQQAGGNAAAEQRIQAELDSATRFAQEAEKQAASAVATAREQSDSILEYMNKGIDEQKAFVTKATDFNQPYIEAGTNALASLQQRIAEGPGEFETSPGYEFRLAEGNKAIDRQQARQGSVLSGQAVKASTRFNQDYASNEYDKFLDQYYDSLKPLERIGDVGAAAAGQSASITANAGQNIAGMMQAGGTNAANALARGKYDSANILAAGDRNVNAAKTAADYLRADNTQRQYDVDADIIRQHSDINTNTIGDIGRYTAAGLTGETGALAEGAERTGITEGAGIRDIGTAQAGGTINQANAITGSIQSGINTGLDVIALNKYLGSGGSSNAVSNLWKYLTI